LFAGAMVLTCALVLRAAPVRGNEQDGAPPAATADRAAKESSKDLSDDRALAEAQLATLGHEAARLRDAGDAAAADALEKRVRHFRDRLAGKAAAEGDGPELHVVGVYEGPPAGGVRRGFDEHPVGAASVEVGPTDRPVVLALCAYEPVKWSVKIADGATVRKVILSGYNDQQVEGLPPAVPMEKQAPNAGGGVQRFYAYAKDLEHYPGMSRQLKQLTGLDVSTFQGEYRAPDHPFVIGPQNSQWVAQRVLKDIRPLYLPAAASERADQQQAMRDLRFWGVLQSFPNNPGLPPEAARHQRVFTLAEFMIGGPVAGTARPLPRDVNSVATDPRGPTHYGLSREGVLQLDMQAGQVVQLAWDPAVGRPGWPLGIAFDTKRGRVVVSTLDRGGRLYAYDVGEKKWSVLADQNGFPIASIAYAPREDAFYGLAMMGGEVPARPVVFRFDGEGRQTGRVVLARRIPSHPHDRPQGGPRVAAVGEYLAVLTPPVVDVDIDPAGPEEPRCYLFEPKTGRLVYSGPLRVQPPSRSEPMTAAELDELWAALRDADDAAADKLMWQMASGGERTVQYLRGKLPPAAPPAAQRVDALVAKLSEEDGAARDEAAAELRQGGTATKAELRRVLKQDLSPDARARAGAVLTRIESDEAAAAEADAPWPPPPPKDPQQRHLWAVAFDAGFLRRPVPGVRWDDDPRLRRDRRGMIILSRTGSPAAVEILHRLAAGTPAAPRTVQARATLNAPEPLPSLEAAEPGDPRPRPGRRPLR
jgi:hypothetical protein